MNDLDPIRNALDGDETAILLQQHSSAGPIGKLLTYYKTTSPNLLGFVLDMSYDEVTIVTCDAWKRKCGGVPKNSFVIIRLNPSSLRLTQDDLPPYSLLILARVTESVATPLTAEVQQTIFAIHKVQAVIDPYTNAELQWGALKATILGTYYDSAQNAMTFGNDIDTYVSPHFYEVYVPHASDLEMLINSFVSTSNPIPIGELRYTETQTSRNRLKVAIMVSPKDFIGNRTALFGKTRMGKSNTIKVIADMILHSGENVGQVIFDLNGEYANVNEWDQTSLFALHTQRCVRYTLNPHPKHFEGVPDPHTLKANFYNQVELGHSIIVSLFSDEHGRQPPKYILPLLDWEPCDKDQLKVRYPDFADRRRYERALSMYFAVLAKANYPYPPTLVVRLCLNKTIRTHLGALKTIRAYAQMERSTTLPIISDYQPLSKAIRIYEHLYKLWLVEQKRSVADDEDTDRGKHQGMKTARAHSFSSPQEAPEKEVNRAFFPAEQWEEEGLDRRDAKGSEDQDETEEDVETGTLFPTSQRTGEPYFNLLHLCLLRMLGDPNIAGTAYLLPFNKYHNVSGGHVERDIVTQVNNGKTVIIDLANADEVITRYYSELVSKAIFRAQTAKFTQGTLGNHSVLFYFEEAHNLFRKDDKDLRSTYNRLAKEGGKNRIGIVYATQSMTTLSPDLLKNTENFFIAHLNDDREIRELTNQYEFKDIALDVQRSKTKGYVRMITLSHRYALPVQIRLFGPPQEE